MKFILGLIIGMFLGVFIMCLLNIGKDDESENG